MREELIAALANLWRYAENEYINSEYAVTKWKNLADEITNACELNSDEQLLLEQTCEAMGV